MLKEKKLKNPQLAIRMGQDAVIDFNDRVGVLTDRVNTYIDTLENGPRTHFKLKKNLLYQALIQWALDEIESCSDKELFEILVDRIGNLKHPDYHK